MAFSDLVAGRRSDARAAVSDAEAALARAEDAVRAQETSLARARQRAAQARARLDDARRSVLRDRAAALRAQARELYQQAEDTPADAIEQVRYVVTPGSLAAARWAGERFEVDAEPVADRLRLRAQMAEVEAARLEHIAGPWAPSETLRNAVASIETTS